jgi:hypothetical protein
MMPNATAELAGNPKTVSGRAIMRFVPAPARASRLVSIAMHPPQHWASVQAAILHRRPYSLEQFLLADRTADLPPQLNSAAAPQERKSKVKSQKSKGKNL